MTQRLKRCTVVLELVLCLLLFCGCQGGGSVLVALDLTDSSEEKTEWQTVLLNEMQKKNGDFLRGDDAMAEKVLECVRSISENKVPVAIENLTEYPGDGYAIGAKDIRIVLNEPSISNEEKTCLVGYAVVPQKNVELWNEKTVNDLADKLMKSRCFISLNEQKLKADCVGFAMDKIGEETFIIAVFQ